LIGRESELRVVAITFIAKKCVSAVKLVPSEMSAGCVERCMDSESAFKWHVRILAAPDHQEFAFDLRHTVEAVILHAFSEATFVDVGGIEASRC
jgi:hypothetical protein